MEQYSKEFWASCLRTPNPSYTLSQDVNYRLEAHGAVIRAFCDGLAIEYCSEAAQGFAPLPFPTCGFHPSVQFRVAPPKLKQCDVVVYYRDKLERGWCGHRKQARFTVPAGIDVARLYVEPTSEHALTLASLQAKTPGFKLLSITRVAVDDNNNLTEYSTKLDNLGRVPF